MDTAKPSKRGTVVTIRYYHLPYLRLIGDSIGANDLSECVNFILNLHRSNKTINQQASISEEEELITNPETAPTASGDELDQAALMSALSEILS